MILVPLSPKDDLGARQSYKGDSVVLSEAAPAGPQPLRFLSLHGGQVSLESAAKLSVAQIFSGELTVNDHAYVLEAIAQTDQEDPVPDGSPDAAIRYGVGVRILFRVWNQDANLSFDYADIGAALQLGLSAATYEVIQYGLGAATALATLLQQFPTGNLTAETFTKLNTTVLSAIQSALADPTANLQPQPITMRIDPRASLADAARSVVYAVENIKEGNPQSRAIQRLPAGVSPEYVARAYETLAGQIPFTDPPSPEASQRAKSWLKTDSGRFWL